MKPAVVIPVRDGASLLGRCLQAVIPQAHAFGAEVVVVDDASSDGTIAAAEVAGARVLPLSVPSGPYVARNAGWRAVDADAVLFTDVRARPCDTWLAALVEALGDPEVAATGGDVVVEWGPSAAQRWAHRNQHLLTRHAREGQFLPYFPACNLGVRREVLEALDGFREARSGGDVDLCWRAQLAGLGQVRAATGATVTWEARAGLIPTVRQFARYGRWNPVLYRRFAADGCETPVPPRLGRQALLEMAGLAGALARGPRRRDLGDDITDRLCRLAYWWAFERSLRNMDA